MRYDPEKHHRRSIRLKGYNYAQPGMYFVTLCTQDRLCLFGEVVNGEMRLNEAGEIVQRCWLEIPHHFPHVELDAFVVMPNHVHGIIVIIHDVGANNYSPLHDSPLHDSPPYHSPLHHLPPHHSPPYHSPLHPSFRSPSKTIGSIIRGFKIGVTKWFRGNTNIRTVWQRNYYEHIIRDEASLHRIREYIADNPLRWALDRENPNRLGDDDFDEWLHQEMICHAR